jgi:hypothetical protein
VIEMLARDGSLVGTERADQPMTVRRKGLR